MTTEQNNSGWYPINNDASTAEPAAPAWSVPEPVASTVSDSTWYCTRLDAADYGERRGFVGDIPAPGPFRRIASVLIDAALSFYIPSAVLDALGVSVGYVILVVLGLTVANAVHRPEYGQTVGKRLLRIQAVRAVRTREGKQALVQRGLAMSVLRAFLHGLDVTLWPIAIPTVLLSRKHRTLADMLTATVLIHPTRIEPLQPAPRHATTLT